MSYRPSRGGFGNSRGGSRGNSYNSNYGSSRGNRGGSNYNDNYRSRGGGTYRGSRGSNRGNSGSWSNNSPSGGYNNMNRNSGSNWSSQGDSNYDSRNRYSGNNDRYSSNQNDDYRRYKEGGRSHRDSDMGGYSSSGDDYGRYSGSSSYIEDRSSRSSYVPDNNYGGNSNYRGRANSRDYGSDFRKPLPPDDDRSSPPSPRYSGPPNRGRGTRGFRIADRSSMRGRSSASVSYRGSFGGSAGLLKRKRLEPPSSWRTNSIRKGYDIANRRIHTVKRISMRDNDDYRARKIAEFREKTRQLRERQRSPSVDEEEIEEEVEEEVEEEESSNEGEGESERQEDDVEKKEKSPKKKKKVMKKVVKVIKKKVKKQKLNGESSKSSSGIKSSPRKTENNLLDSRGEPFIKLLCPHCEVTCKTFREYEIHLLKIRHRTAMSQLARKRKHELFMFRQEQRKEQKEIDEKAIEEDPKTDINYCKLCQLNFKQAKSDHFSSTLHKKIKQFLQPACNVCHLMFASPMRYEHHLCSTNHLKKVDVYERRTKRMAAVPSADEADGDVDMDNFMVLDSVGSGDDEGSEESENVQDSKDAEKKKKSLNQKKEISLGKEFCKKVEVIYCELCKFNLPPHDDVEQQLSLHCRNRVHLQRYVQHCEKIKSREKSSKVISKEESTEETKSDSDSSNKDVGNEDKNDASDNGDDKSSVHIQQDEEMKNEFDWASLDTVIESDKNKEDSDTEKSVA